ncbi:MAG: protein of unknown function transrane [Betaproteobacteria bacterium]|nr:protein of unknown function transrane [Betaproteobacteria bacterium]
MSETQTLPTPAPPARAYAVLAIGVLIVSTAAILIRYAHAQGVPSLSIAAWRLTLAALWLAPVALMKCRGQLRALQPAQWALALASGAFLGVHFASWIVSLEYTTVASSVVLVTTNPIWLALFAWTFLHERLSLRLSLAVALALIGSVAIFMADQSAESASRPALGNGLAILGSLSICGYLLIGRKLRSSVGLLPYISIVYASAAVCLMAAAIVAGAQLHGYGTAGWLLLGALALGPQLLGHGAVNYALKYFPATVIAVAVLGEPIGSSALAWLLFDESIGVVKFIGMALLLGGIFLAANARSR